VKTATVRGTVRYSYVDFMMMILLSDGGAEILSRHSKTETTLKNRLLRCCRPDPAAHDAALGRLWTLVFPAWSPNAVTHGLL